VDVKQRVVVAKKPLGGEMCVERQRWWPKQPSVSCLSEGRGGACRGVVVAAKTALPSSIRVTRVHEGGESPCASRFKQRRGQQRMLVANKTPPSHVPSKEGVVVGKEPLLMREEGCSVKWKNCRCCCSFIFAIWMKWRGGEPLSLSSSLQMLG